ncbi:MAG: DUF11 domain-containing protein [Clostridia bacterium]|nr:DUF11 domain-containing protein [Clostridia bacterium]
MATIITNRATVNYSYGRSSAVTVSNTASTVLNGTVEISKFALSNAYRAGGDITYIITVTNSGNSALGDITVADDLGSIEFGNGRLKTLDYIGPAQLYTGGMYVSALTPITTVDGISFNIGNLPIGETATIIYVARANQNASSALGESITNTATARRFCDCPCDFPSSASATVYAEAYGDLRVIKSVCPNPVVCGEQINYIIDLYNYGNTVVGNVVLSDVFDPLLTDLTVSIDGNVIPASQYNYVNGTLTLPNRSGSEITVPAASFTRNEQSGAVNINPGHIQITLSGNIAI